MIRLAGLGIALLLAACGANAVPATPSPPASLGNTQRTLDPDSPYRTTPQEYALQLRACLEDKGFSVEVDPYDFHLQFQLGSDSRTAELQATVTECRAGLDPSRNDPPPPLTEEQLRALYRYRLAQADCLVAAGYPTAPAPPEQVFVDTGGQWDARVGLEDAAIPQGVSRGCEQIQGRPNFLDW